MDLGEEVLVSGQWSSVALRAFLPGCNASGIRGAGGTVLKSFGGRFKDHWSRSLQQRRHPSCAQPTIPRSAGI